MRAICLALALASLAGCAPATPLQCNQAAFAGFYCDEGHYLARSEVEAACHGTPACHESGRAICVHPINPDGSSSPAGALSCTNGTVSETGTFAQ